MRQNLMDPRPTAAQPVVGAVPQMEDEPDVTSAETAVFARLSSRLAFNSRRQML
jgi:hypothetical protein